MTERVPAQPLGGPTQVFDPVGKVFNGQATPRVARTYVRRVADDQQTQPVATWSPRVRRGFGAANDQPVVAAQQVNDVHHEPLVGNFSGVRAAQVLQQYQIGFWTDAGIVDMVASNTESDPTQAQIDQMYADLQLFSYMPTDMLPSPAQFADQVTPSRRAAALRSSLVTAGILTNNTWSTPQPAVEPTPMITDSPPFADKLTDWCASRSYLQQTNWF